jgi:hypothetical protein
MSFVLAQRVCLRDAEVRELRAAEGTFELVIGNAGEAELQFVVTRLVFTSSGRRRAARLARRCALAPRGSGTVSVPAAEPVDDGTAHCWFAYGPTNDPWRFSGRIDFEVRDGFGTPHGGAQLDLSSFGL